MVFLCFMPSLTPQLGFQWQCRFPRKKKPGPVRSFEERVEELIEYRIRYGDTLVPYTFPEGLGVWSHVIRYEYRKFMKGQKTTLTEERINVLKEVRVYCSAVQYINVSFLSR